MEGLGSMTPPWMGMPSWMHPHLEQAHERGAVGTMRLQGGENEGRGLEVEDEGGARAPHCVAEVAEGKLAGFDRTAHCLAFVGPLVYCTRCAIFAHRRVGVGMKGICAAPSNKRANAVAARPRRLQLGRHPITGRFIVGL